MLRRLAWRLDLKLPLVLALPTLLLVFLFKYRRPIIFELWRCTGAGFPLIPLVRNDDINGDFRLVAFRVVCSLLNALACKSTHPRGLVMRVS